MQRHTMHYQSQCFVLFCINATILMKWRLICPIPGKRHNSDMTRLWVHRKAQFQKTGLQVADYGNSVLSATPSLHCPIVYACCGWFKYANVRCVVSVERYRGLVKSGQYLRDSILGSWPLDLCLKFLELPSYREVSSWPQVPFTSLPCSLPVC